MDCVKVIVELARSIIPVSFQEAEVDCPWSLQQIAIEKEIYSGLLTLIL